ncbi:hypothetical protein SAMN05444920_110210 [Nonomuraea solani]|uniref:Uncharacterized protein n=1 Tax=Nonomuraea solani TaxID=1144553 RepID=A0A1H6EIT1_9ACTN|nr:hypothetical protein [Nonomuraea solani]SEG97091.1 hypothetical protein SAMN05444920_110210 [Nonomuraea solani]
MKDLDELLRDDGATVDLDEVWPQVRRAGSGERRIVELLAGQAGGTGRRLLFGVRSLYDRSDRDMEVRVRAAETDVLEIAAWSLGCALNPDRSWWLRCTPAVLTGLGLEGHGANGLRLFPHRAVFAVGGQDGVTVFRENASGPLGDEAARFYLAWEGRQAITARLARPRPEPGPETDAEDLPLEEFLRQARRRVWS